MKLKAKNLVGKFIKDKNGKVVIWQFPNLFLAGWFVFMVVAHFVGSAHIKNDFGSLSTISLFIWACLEIISGASYFRRTLGLIILLDVVLSRFG